MNEEKEKMKKKEKKKRSKRRTGRNEKKEKTGIGKRQVVNKRLYCMITLRTALTHVFSAFLVKYRNERKNGIRQILL